MNAGSTPVASEHSSSDATAAIQRSIQKAANAVAVALKQSASHQVNRVKLNGANSFKYASLNLDTYSQFRKH